MCIALTSTEHPDYPFILLSNRDEYFDRPTKEAHLRRINEEYGIISPLDMAREERGTWIGVNTKGKFSSLVNFREMKNDSVSEVSRGIIPLSYLTYGNSDKEWMNDLNTVLSKMISSSSSPKDNAVLPRIGGFSLLYGQLKINENTGKIEPLRILSNKGNSTRIHVSESEPNSKSDSISGLTTFGISNSLFDDPWPKVELGKELLHETINESVEQKWSFTELIDNCFKLLSHNTYNENIASTGSPESKLEELRNSIFIPPITPNHESSSSPNSSTNALYGTRTQTLLILDKKGALHYLEENVSTEHHSDTVRHMSFNINNSHE
ncbi:Piso0_005876 [Millerozyma farinosa CBS 7064]|uniref:Piso0_005876 protein n=1 Tax=Pichia sorbitophila (strain ATCC MYA-4447 / BCRC 22081 / CBS 7064 / NBRC 10061 / NRRL Y-12695) TaxID=559304 RepID=G8Y358_PICSO|nr:Piso0_005876 [Millerozyma farinosa CBS 7064]